jgi:hypothetical protein
MGKELKHRRDEKKKPLMSIKERRAMKHEKRQHRQEHQFDGGNTPAQEL